MVSRNRTLRCAASTMYSMTGANRPNGAMVTCREDECSWMDGIFPLRFAFLLLLCFFPPARPVVNSRCLPLSPVPLPHQVELDVGVRIGAEPMPAAINITISRPILCLEGQLRVGAAQ